jgi:hypothetical protein
LNNPARPQQYNGGYALDISVRYLRARYSSLADPNSRFPNARPETPKGHEKGLFVISGIFIPIRFNRIDPRLN